MTKIRRLCVFCGSSPGARSQYAEAALELGSELVARGIGLVYGGGCVGLMGILADRVLAEGGHVIGVIPRALMDLEVGHRGLSDLRIVASMHERKALMAELSDGFVALPGGLGTLDECFEILTWAQLGLHSKPVGLLNVAGYFDRLLGFLDHAVDERFLRPEHRQLVQLDDQAASLLDRLAMAPVPALQKWIDRDET